MRLMQVLLFLLCVDFAWAGQPKGVRLDAAGMSYIYPVFDSPDWIMTQPSPSRMYVSNDSTRVTHWADEYYAQDWARGCGQTFSMRLYAGISGQVVLAGSRGPYGYTVVIYDQPSGFALKYSHLSEVSVSNGDYVLAGKSLVGRVGNTGNVQSTGCNVNGGAHLHLALFKNVVDPTARPITTTSAVAGTAATQFAASFGYAASEDLIMSNTDPTVYVSYYGSRVPVTYGSFVSNGWAFDKNQSVFNAMHNKVVAPVQLQAQPAAYYLWPHREGSLIRAKFTPTVYQIEDGQKRALSAEVFSCRGLRFGEVVEVPVGERDLFLPLGDVAATSCVAGLKQSLSDWRSFAQARSLLNPDWASYFYQADWDPNWEMRSLNFKNRYGQTVKVQLIRSIANGQERYGGYHDPLSGSWVGWHRIN